jgi:hypothetical protein
MRHWCSEHKFCSKCRSFEEAGNCPKVKQSNYNPNNPSSNPKVSLDPSPTNKPIKIDGFVGCFRTLLFTPFTLLIIANVFVENGTVQGWKKVLRLLYGYGIGQGWGFQFLSCPCQDSWRQIERGKSPPFPTSFPSKLMGLLVGMGQYYFTH